MGSIGFTSVDRPSLSGGPSADPAVIARITEFCVIWERSVKTITLYPSSNHLPEEFRQKFFDMLLDVLELTDQLVLEVTDTCMTVSGQTVYERGASDENLAYVFFRDGICKIAFERGITREESDRFLAAVADAFAAPGIRADIANRLWKEALPHISHYTLDRLIEGSYIDIADDSVIESRHQSFIGDDSPPDTQPVVTGQDGSVHVVPYQGVQAERCSYVLKVFGDVSSLTTVEKDQLARLMATEQEDRGDSVGLEILFEILRTADSPRLIEETIAVTEKQFQGFVEADCWGMVRSILESWQSSIPATPASVSKQIRSALMRAADQRHFEALSQYLNTNPQCDLDEVRGILKNFGAFAITLTTAMLGVLEHRPARLMVCDFLARNGQEAIDLIGGFVYDKRWFVVRNVAKILGDIGSERALGFLKKSARHSDPRVRIETINALRKIPGTGAERLLIEFIRDEDQQLRMRALRAVGKRRVVSAATVLRAMVDYRALLRCDPTEAREILIAYARSGGRGAFERIRDLARKTKWFGRRRWLPIRLYAIQALSECATLEARTELAVLSHSGSPRIASTAADALAHWERRQTETGPGAPNEIGTEDNDDE